MSGVEAMKVEGIVFHTYSIEGVMGTNRRTATEFDEPIAKTILGNIMAHKDIEDGGLEQSESGTYRIWWKAVKK